MLSKLVIAIVIGVVTTLVCIFVGGLLETMSISWVVATGTFLKTYGALLGLLAALYQYFNGNTLLHRG